MFIRIAQRAANWEPNRFAEHATPMRAREIRTFPFLDRRRKAECQKVTKLHKGRSFDSAECGGLTQPRRKRKKVNCGGPQGSSCTLVNQDTSGFPGLLFHISKQQQNV